MDKIILLMVMLIGLSNCTTSNKSEYVYQSDLIKIRQVKKNVFVHVSYLDTDSYGKVACNGMVYINADEAIIFDTPTDDAASL